MVLPLITSRRMMSGEGSPVVRRRASLPFLANMIVILAVVLVNVFPLTAAPY